MDYVRNIVLVAAIAGAVAGLAMTVAQQLTTVPLILKAEVYEEHGATPAAHNHGDAAQAPVHQHDEEGWSPANGFERTAFSTLANILTGVGFALLLVAASELAGGIRNWCQGVFWGLAGFAVFTLAPSLGLPPELPAMRAPTVVGRDGGVYGHCSRPSGLWPLAMDRARCNCSSDRAALDRRAATRKLRDADPRKPASQLRRCRGANDAAVLGTARGPRRVVPRPFPRRKLSHGRT